MENPIRQPKYKILDYVYVIRKNAIRRATILGVDICLPFDDVKYLYKIRLVEKDKITNKWYIISEDDIMAHEEDIETSKERILKKFISEQNKYLNGTKKEVDKNIELAKKYLDYSEC